MGAICKAGVIWAGLLLFAQAVVAQEQEPVVPPPLPPAPMNPLTPQPPRTVPRDPTTPEGELRMLLVPQTPTQPGAMPNALPAEPVLPNISVRGRLVGPNSTSALLSVGEKYHLVMPGKTYSLFGSTYRGMKVLEVTRDGVSIQFLPDGPELILP